MGLVVYGGSALLFAAGQYYVHGDPLCTDGSVDAYDLINVPDCYPLLGLITGFIGFFLAMLMSSFCCLNKMKLCPLLSVVLFAGAGVMGLYYIQDVANEAGFDNYTDELKAFIIAPGAYLLLVSVSLASLPPLGFADRVLAGVMHFEL